MIRLFVRHRVSDFPTWKKAYDDFDPERRDRGVKTDAVFQTVNDPEDVTVWHDFETMEAATKFIESARLKEVMGQAGVTGDPTIWFAEEV